MVIPSSSDATTQSRILDSRGEPSEVTEFDYKGVNEVAYQENGVTIRSIPAIHAIDGAARSRRHTDAT